MIGWQTIAAVILSLVGVAMMVVFGVLAWVAASGDEISDVPNPFVAIGCAGFAVGMAIVTGVIWWLRA